jgi:NAD(P)-dependent dehydrogenase (short-subunit alcohol dehydrogenase family)
MNIVITGASSGIGRETAIRLSDEPGNVIYAIARNRKALTSLSEAARHKNIIPVPNYIASGRSSPSELKKRPEEDIEKILKAGLSTELKKRLKEDMEKIMPAALSVDFKKRLKRIYPTYSLTEICPVMAR